MIEALFKYQFLQNAVVAAVLASVVCGIIGVIIVEKKLVMMSGGIAHTAYGGVGLGYLLGFEPMLGAVGFSLAAAFGIGFVKRRGKANSDVLIALFWSLGMALGIAFIGFMKGYPPDMNSYLFGNILTVSRTDILLMSILTVVVLAVIIIFFNYWKTYLFDEEFASVIGLNTALLEYLLLVLVALTVVVLIRVAGIILVLALLTAPSATAGLLTRDLKKRMVLAVGIGIICCLAGLYVSYALNIASGATIIIISVLAYFAVYLISSIIKKKQMKATSRKI